MLMCITDFSWSCFVKEKNSFQVQPSLLGLSLWGKVFSCQELQEREPSRGGGGLGRCPTTS